MYVKPFNEDARVPNPERRRYLKAEGEHVPETSYWHRRLIAGDVVPADPPPAPAAVPDKPAESPATKRGSRTSAAPQED